MNEGMGILWICGACALFVQYRPRTRENRMLCVMTAVMGFAALTAGAGNMLFTAVQTVLMLVTGVCCVIQVRREHFDRVRRLKKLRSLRLGKFRQVKEEAALWLTEPEERGILNPKAEGRRTA